MNKENRAHDLAIAYLEYKMDIERMNSDAEHDEEKFFSMYKKAYDSFYELLP